MNKDITEIDGACHCGAVRFHARLANGLHAVRRCDCSICRMRGAVVASAALDGLTVIQGAEALATYRFNTMTAAHHFCTKCGIYTHHQRRSNPAQYAVNVACLQGISPFDFEEVPVNDGVHHPSDDPHHTTRVIGILRFEPAPTGNAGPA